MKKQRNVNLLLMLVLLVAVGQMAQTIYIPAIADMAKDLSVREGAVQSVMAAYLLTYGVSQLVYGPLSDRVGRRPVILVGMSIFMVATVIAITTHSLTILIAARGALEKGKIHPTLGLWWVHAIFLFIGLGLLYWEPLRLKMASRRAAALEVARG